MIKITQNTQINKNSYTEHTRFELLRDQMLGSIRQEFVTAAVS